jgi:hypothetical protein
VTTGKGDCILRQRSKGCQQRARVYVRGGGGGVKEGDLCYNILVQVGRQQPELYCYGSSCSHLQGMQAEFLVMQGVLLLLTPCTSAHKAGAACCSALALAQLSA